MGAKVGDFILSRVMEWGVKRIYGYPGDGINGILGAFGRLEEGKLEFIQARHEEWAAFEACAHAKYTGEVGVCMATSGPGAIHLLNGLYDAKSDHQPVVAIVGQAHTTALGGHYQQEVDLASLFKDVAHEFCETIVNPAQARHVIDRAFRIAKAERTVTCIIVPGDIQELDAVETPPHAHNTVHSGNVFLTPRVLPTDADLQKAAFVLNSGEKVAILIGQGARGAAAEVTEVADLLGAGVAKALLGKDVLSDELPFVTGSIGLLGTKPSYDMMAGCDTLLMIGSSFPYSEFLPKEGQARGVQIDLDPKMIDLRYPMEVPLVGDSKETLQALLPLLKRKTERKWREEIEKGIKEWWQTVENRAQVEAKPLNPELVFWELSKRLPDNVIMAADSGSVANWYARNLKMRPGMRGTLSGTLATMCPPVPYCIAAKFAYPDRPVIGFIGDGAMQMSGISEMITVGKYWKQWTDPRFIIMVLNNRDLNQVTWELRALGGSPKFEDSQNVPDFPYAQYAELLGFKGIKVDKPEEVGPAWEEALRADRPVIFEAFTDPDVPTLPPHITVEQAKHYTQAVLKGDPNALGIISQTVKEAVSDIFTSKEK